MYAPPTSSQDALLAGLERLDAASVVQSVETLVTGGMPVADVLRTVLLPAWEELNARRDAGEVDHAATGAAAVAARRALAAAVRTGGPTERPTGSGSLVVAGPAGSSALFGAEIVAELAVADGWSVETLCAPTPAELAAYLGAASPAALVMTAHDVTSLPDLFPLVGVAHGTGTPVLAWGPAFGVDDRRARAVGAEAWAPTVGVALDLLGVWRSRPPAVGGVVRLGAAHGEVQRLRPALLAAAGGACGGEGLVQPWIEEGAVALVDHLAAAVGLADPTVIAEHLERERQAVLHSDVVDDRHLVGLVDAVAAALPLTSVVAREYLFTSREDLRRAMMGAPRPRIDRRPSSAAPEAAAGAGQPGASPSAGQAFADVLLLAALACQTPFAVLSVPQPGGAWSTLSYGFEQRSGLNDPRLFDLVAAQVEPVEITDLAAHAELARTAFAQAPHHLRWVYAVALRPPGGEVAGVIAVMDRWLRESGRREGRALQAAARQAMSQLGQVRRAPAPSGWAATPAAPALPGGLAQPPAPTKADPLAALRRASSLQEGQQLLRSHEVAVLFDVTERTVINWAAAGKLPSLRTIGGHLRFRSEDVLELLAGRTSSGSRRG